MLNYNESWSPYLKALYWDKKDNWIKAHELVQDLSTAEAAWIHAYLHRKEGDEGNAAYWYRKAGKSFFAETLDEEWEELWEAFNQA